MLDVFYLDSEDGHLVHQGLLSTIGQPFLIPRIGEKVVVAGVQWKVVDVVWDLDCLRVEFTIKSY